MLANFYPENLLISLWYWIILVFYPIYTLFIVKKHVYLIDLSTGLGPAHATPSAKTFANHLAEGRKRFLLRLQSELAARLMPERLQAQAAPSHDKAGLETEANDSAKQQTLTTPFVDEDKLKLLNSIAQSMGFKKNVAFVPNLELAQIIKVVRIQQQIAQLAF